MSEKRTKITAAEARPQPEKRSSFQRQWRAERQKARRRRIWLVPLAFGIFQLLWAVWQLSNASGSELASGYLQMFFDVTMINVIVLPLMIAVLASRLCDMEIKGDTLKLLYTLQKRSAFYDCKYLAGLKYIAVFVLGQGAALILLGRLYRFGDPLKPTMMLEYLAVTFSVSAVLLAAQQLLSLLSDSQILPLAVGLTGCFLGLFSMFFPPAVSRLILWGYYARFPFVEMDWDSATRVTAYREIPFPLTDFLLFLLFGCLLCAVCRAIVVKKEV